ncbi:transcriptional repressor [Paenibacillus melissococcoides]|uniref:Transcriptional repressor n=1 Tax=Paenibacillus melissococcoides TaxID=2912268 RepID=A0ABM9FV49_9BACL|nr:MULTISPECIES: transcriptional repressor [Paenibacillus]MEB9896183.1 transcriptional repressor [Bacillus cereus]CAH8243020.1 transcriptional repressor [Paenibacillus melissococcoides]CAH8703594.1 transcriptional repressor [Paenibacillus melissococcoides]CAH8706553.1 transcriptional repressor [Paenibacillus melissococcoides]GIO79042.1 hypothetical protein J6TS7_26520 [Paenibacillus dendritiformis]
MGHVNHNKVEASVVRQGKDKKMHMTQQREAVYACIRQAASPMTAMDVFLALKSGGQLVSLSTVYCSLKYFVKKGLVHELQDDQLSKRYKHACPICRGA